MKANDKKIYLLAQENVGIALLKLGIPTMIGMMISALYNLVDSYFVGKLGTAQIGAVSVVYPLSLVVLGLGLLFGAGASSYLARLLGKGKKEEADKGASTALAASVLTGVVIVVFMLIFINPILKYLGATDSIMPYAREYAIPFISGLAINVFNITLNNIITAEGASFYGMIAMLLGGICNMFLDPLFIFSLNMGVRGAAAATLISRLISSAIYISYLLSGKSNFTFAFTNIRFEKKIFVEIFKIGVPMLVYQILCSVAMTITNHEASIYGDSAVAAFGIVNRIITFGAQMLTGFLKGYQPFVGYNFGAGKPERVKEATKKMIIGSTIACLAAAVILIFARTQIIHAFSQNDAEVMKIGTKILIISAIDMIGMGYMMVHNFRFMGLGKAKEGAIISVARQGIFFIPIILILSHVFGLNGVIVSQFAADVCSYIMVVVLVRKNKKEMPLLA